jgi:hypothetical protein
MSGTEVAGAEKEKNSGSECESMKGSRQPVAVTPAGNGIGIGKIRRKHQFGDQPQKTALTIKSANIRGSPRICICLPKLVCNCAIIFDRA